MRPDLKAWLCSRVAFEQVARTVNSLNEACLHMGWTENDSRLHPQTESYCGTPGTQSPRLPWQLPLQLWERLNSTCGCPSADDTQMLPWLCAWMAAPRACCRCVKGGWLVGCRSQLHL